MAESADPHPRRQTLDILVAVLQERMENGFKGVHDRLDNLRIHQSEIEAKDDAHFERLDESMGQLNLRERERNANINKLFDWRKTHEEWHGQNDKSLTQRLTTIETERRDLEKVKEGWGQVFRIVEKGASILGPAVGLGVGLILGKGF